jgi:hypothetical protein
MNAATLPALIQRFFTDRLCVQMEASRHTVAGYRDTFRLLLRSRAFDTASHRSSSRWKTSTPIWSLTSSFMARPRAATARVAATRGLPRSARSSATSR